MSTLSYLPFDLADCESQNRALEQVQREAGGLDILVNNAFFHAQSMDEARKEKDTSLKERKNAFCSDLEGFLAGSAVFTEAAWALLQRSDQARIVNIASMYGIVAPDPNLYVEHPEQRSKASYNAAKAALLQLTRYWASFWGEGCPSLTVNAISPGPFPRSEKQVSASFRAMLSRRTIVGRTGVPEDLSGALLLLSSRAGSYITAQNLVVDGGWTAR